MLLAVTIIVMTFTQCSKNDPTPAKPADVYVAGNFNTLAPSGYNFIPVYWKNGVMTKLSESPGDARAMAIVGNDIYVIGKLDSNGDKWSIWKNGVMTDFADATAYVYSMKAIGSDIYVCGMINSHATYWKNGTPHSINSTYESRAYDLAIDGTDVYLVGMEYSLAGGSEAKIWKNDAPTSLTDGNNYADADGIAITNGDVYVTGQESSTLKMWKNGAATTLGTGGQSGTSNNSIAILKNDVYVSGYDNNEAKVWKNGVATALPKPEGITTTYGYSLATQGNNIFVLGEGSLNGTYPVLVWKNGELTDYDGTIKGSGYSFSIAAAH